MNYIQRMAHLTAIGTITTYATSCFQLSKPDEDHGKAQTGVVVTAPKLGIDPQTRIPTAEFFTFGRLTTVDLPPNSEAESDIEYSDTWLFGGVKNKLKIKTGERSNPVKVKVDGDEVTIKNLSPDTDKEMDIEVNAK